ncbi:DNA mismatch repair endonuclease MutL [Anaplasma marginale]|uniref:DNA mismatch repair endonuclease MutL n=1 Tax=Anaplasma marginale TaxID=770 RepID=UPI001F072AEA|nr:DNA mismatch repair endonuclease MutL [Anaplasma marginale]
MPIVVLDAKTVNKIAAGEVIDCPASVVKELVENSIDAGATTINVLIDKGGRNLISVIDDGCGIPRDEMERAFICHATSKLPDNDLNNIRSMGFRGEGLTSIAAVARTKMVSKYRGCTEAWSIVLEGGEKTRDLSPEALPCGTSIEVRDLFFATPTRLKFLRTEKAETQSIVDLMYRFATARFSTAFSLTIADKQIFKYPAREDLMSRLWEMKPFGDAFREQSLEVRFHSDAINITGYISVPTFNRSRPDMIYTFVNGRPVHSTLFMGAIKSAYSEFIPRDRHPVVVMCMEILPGDVDVNVHPSKLEVRFRNRKQVYSVVVEALATALSSNVYRELPPRTPVGGGLDHFAVDNTPVLDTPHYGKVHDYGVAVGPKLSVQQTGGGGEFSSKPEHAIENPPRAAELFSFLGSGSSRRTTRPVLSYDSEAHIVPLIEELPLGNAVCQLFDRYIVSRAGDHVIIVDQHAAHERLTYEYMKKVTANEGMKRQVLLMPELVELDNEYELELLGEYKEKLLKFGLVIEPMGSMVVAVREVPAILGVFDVKAMIAKIVESIVEVGDALFMREKIKHVCGTIACYSSIRSGRTLKLEEMNSLLRQMEDTPHSGQCNHGRPTYVKLSLSEIDRLFERR